MTWIKKWFSKKNNTTTYHKTYENDDIIRLFDDLEAAYVKKTRMRRYYENLAEKENTLEQYSKLEKDELDKLVNWVNEYKNIDEKRKLLQGRLIKNNRALYKLTEYEEVLPSLIDELKGVEKKVKESERDIFYLQEENEDLKEEREYLIKGYKFLKGFSIAFIVIIALLTLASFAFMQTLRETIWIYLSGFSCALILFLVGIMYTKDKIEKELRDNGILQQKAVKYINKSKIRYFHNIRYLQFQFDKLEVDSVAKLEMYYNRYIKNKHNEVAYSKYNKQLMTIENQINNIFASKEIVIDVLENIEEWLRSPKQASKIKDLLEEKDKIKEQITMLEAYEEELIKEIMLLGEEVQYQGIISKKMQDYGELTKSYLDKEAEYA